MAENKVIIEVEVEGAQQAQKTLNNVAQSTNTIAQNAKMADQQTTRLGETFSSVGDETTKTSSAMNRGIMVVQGGLGEADEMAVKFGRAMITLADNGGRGLIQILGPIGAVVAGVMTIYEGIQELSGESQKLEQITAAVTAAASDLTSKMEELADKGIKPTVQQVRTLIEVNTESRLQLEYLNEQNASLTDVYIAQIEAKARLEKATKDFNQLKMEDIGLSNKIISQDAMLNLAIDKNTEVTSEFYMAQADLERINTKVSMAQERLTQGYNKALPAIQKAQEYQRNLAMTQEEALDALRAQLEAQEEYNNLLIETGRLSDYEKSIQLKQRELRIDQDISAERSQTVQQIQDLTKKIEDENKARSQTDLLALKEKKNLQEIQALKEAEIKRLQDEARARSDAFKARQQQIINEQSQINALRIQLEKQGVDEQLALAVNTYTTQLALNKNNKNQLIIAELQYQQQLNDISQQEIARQQADQASLLQAQTEKIRILQDEAYKEIAIEKEKAKTKKDLQDKIDLLDIQLTMSGNAQQVALLQKQMDMELAIVEKGSLEAIEIKKRYALAGKDLQDESIAQLKDFADAQAQSFSASVASAIMNGESIQATLKASLKGLATEALARSLYEGAAGLASLALGPVGGVPASQHFAASAAFAGVATVAGLAGASIPSATTGGAQGGASPTGMAQSPQIQRPEASKQEPLVFNLNFSGSTIYDTKESAKRAMSDEIVKYINEPRRGAPRLRVN
jgi:hypothetical protein